MILECVKDEFLVDFGLGLPQRFNTLVPHSQTDLIETHDFVLLGYLLDHRY